MGERRHGQHAKTGFGRGVFIIFEIDSHNTMHKLVFQWSVRVRVTFKIEALPPNFISNAHSIRYVVASPCRATGLPAALAQHAIHRGFRRHVDAAVG